MSLFGTVQFVFEFAEAEVWLVECSTLEGEAFILTDLPSRRGFGWVMAKVWQGKTHNFAGFSVRLLSSNPL